VLHLFFNQKMLYITEKRLRTTGLRSHLKRSGNEEEEDWKETRTEDHNSNNKKEDLYKM